MPKRINMIGKKYGRLTIISESDKRDNSGGIKYNCLCKCGNNYITSGYILRRGTCKSCGCLQKENRPNFNKDRKEQLTKYLYKDTRLKNKGCSLEFSFFSEIILKSCYYCGSKPLNIIRDIRQGKIITDTVLYYNGLDRIDSNKGYSKNNIVTCCKFCNRAKSVMTQKEFKEWILKIYNYYIKP